MQFHITLKSKNTKTGKIPVTTSSADTCPDACPLKSQGCYAKSGPLGMFWDKVTAGNAGASFDDMLAIIASLPNGQLWRHNQAGDLAGENNHIDADKLAALTQANKGKRGFTYTHKPMTPDNASAVASAVANGFTINLSADNLNEADELSALAIGPVVTILPVQSAEKLHTPEGRTVIVCPAQTRDDVTCASCGLCQRADRKVIVGFRAHGVSKKRAESVFFSA